MIRLTTGRLIARRRISCGYADAVELCEAVHQDCGVRLEPEALGDMEAGRREFPLDVVAVLACFFGVTIDELAGVTRLPAAARSRPNSDRPRLFSAKIDGLRPGQPAKEIHKIGLVPYEPAGL
ncbi:MAG: hypothetical protein RIF32_14395 [Leptospirales bacterium]